MLAELYFKTHFVFCLVRWIYPLSAAHCDKHSRHGARPPPHSEWPRHFDHQGERYRQLCTTLFYGLSLQELFLVPQLPRHTVSGGCCSEYCGTLATQSRSPLNQQVYRYPQEVLYNVVSNVDDYQNFVPWCVGSKVLKRQVSMIERICGF